MTTVLIFDDDENLRSPLCARLVGRDVEVLEVSTGVAADDALAHASVGLVVVGSSPGRAGIEWIERLRARDRRTRVVFLSASHRDMETLDHLKRNLDVSLVAYRPVDAEELALKVVRLLEAASPDGGGGRGGSRVDALAEIRKRFAARLPDKLAELSQAVADTRSDLSRSSVARGMAHRLRGSAGSYGYGGVGLAVGRVEELLTELAHPAAATRRFFWEEVEGALRDARLALVATSEKESVGAGVPAAKTLLVVDDDAEFLRLMTRVGHKLLVNVIAATTPVEARKSARAQPLIGVIIDVHDHADQSFQLARQIRATGQNVGVPVAFASVDHRIETRVAAIEAGGTRFFDKPFSEESVGALVQQFLNLAEASSGHVVIVDDDHERTEHHAQHLRAAGITVSTLPTADRLVETLEDKRPDVLLVDVNLPGISGIDVCRALRMSDRWELLPILVVTSFTDATIRLQAFQAGASDVVAEPVLPVELLARVGVQLDRMRLLRDRSDKDLLSGLLLRRAFIEAFERALASCIRDERALSVVLIDIDDFKKINDTFGHTTGDRVIASLGDMLRRRFRVEDLRGRWGGDELILVFPGQHVDFAEKAAQRLLQEVGDQPFTSEGGEIFNVTFTAGVAGFPEDATSISALVKRADELLYLGKRTGRNQVCRTRSPAAKPPG